MVISIVKLKKTKQSNWPHYWSLQHISDHCAPSFVVLSFLAWIPSGKRILGQKVSMVTISVLESLERLFVSKFYNITQLPCLTTNEFIYHCVHNHGREVSKNVFIFCFLKCDWNICRRLNHNLHVYLAHIWLVCLWSCKKKIIQTFLPQNCGQCG